METVGNIYINGLIGNCGEDGDDFVELADVISQVRMQPKATSFNVWINSCGGFVDVGFQIHDFLKGIGKPITTIGQGIVASMGTVIFMAGDTRILKPNTEFMIHLPSGGIEGNSEEILEYAGFMSETEKRMIKFYSDLTGLDKLSLKALLSNETWLDPEKAFSLGFANVKPELKQAVAYFNLKTNRKMSKETLTEEDKKFWKGFQSRLTKLFGNAKAVLTIQDANGDDLTFPDLEEGDEVSVGDSVTFAGAPAEGDYTAPNGTVYKCVAGKVTEIVEAAPADDNPDMEEALEQIENLETEKAELETKLAAAKAAEAKALKSLATAKKEFGSLQKQFTSKFDFTGVKKDKDDDGEEEEKLTTAQKMKAKLAERKAAKNKAK